MCYFIIYDVAVMCFFKTGIFCYAISLVAEQVPKLSTCVCIFISFSCKANRERPRSLRCLSRKKIREISHLCFLLSARFSSPTNLHAARPQVDSNIYADYRYRIYPDFYSTFFCSIYRFKNCNLYSSKYFSKLLHIAMVIKILFDEKFR